MCIEALNLMHENSCRNVGVSPYNYREDPSKDKSYSQSILTLKRAGQNVLGMEDFYNPV